MPLFNDENWTDFTAVGGGYAGWTAGTLVTADTFQDEIIENLKFLKNPATGIIIGKRTDEEEPGEEEISTNSSTFINVFNGVTPDPIPADDAHETAARIQLTTYGGHVFLLFVARVKAAGDNSDDTLLKMDFTIGNPITGNFSVGDSASVPSTTAGAGKGLVSVRLVPGEKANIVMPWLATNVAAGLNTFKVKWATTDGQTVKIQRNTPFQFVVREL